MYANDIPLSWYDNQGCRKQMESGEACHRIFGPHNVMKEMQLMLGGLGMPP